MSGGAPPAPRVLLGVSGGIAAYKAAEIVRLLVDRGAGVRVLMTPAAQRFITPLTLSVLSKSPVVAELEYIEPLWTVLESGRTTIMSWAPWAKAPSMVCGT